MNDPVGLTDRGKDMQSSMSSVPLMNVNSSTGYEYRSRNIGFSPNDAIRRNNRVHRTVVQERCQLHIYQKI